MNLYRFHTAIHWQLAFKACADGWVFKFRANKNLDPPEKLYASSLNIRTMKLLIFPFVNWLQKSSKYKVSLHFYVCLDHVLQASLLLSCHQKSLCMEQVSFDITWIVHGVIKP